MSGILCSFVGGSFGSGLPVPIGDAYEGGFFAGQINDGGTIYNIVISPKSSGEDTNTQYKVDNTATPNANSRTDGPTNTASQMADGAADHPAGNFCNNLSIGGYSDWYMPAIDELEVIFYNLKPMVRSNNSGGGPNLNAVPPRSGNYTNSPADPDQTPVTAFQTGGSEAINDDVHLSSSDGAPTGTDFARHIRTNFFGYGYQGGGAKSNTGLTVRAIRRVPA